MAGPLVLSTCPVNYSCHSNVQTRPSTKTHCIMKSRKQSQHRWPQFAQILLLIIALSLVAIAAMLERGYPLNHSTHFNLSWGFQYQTQFLTGQLYPRWLEFSNFGFGNPTFAFYPPLCMVATLPFRLLGLGLSASLVGSMGLATGLLGLGLYLYSRCFFSHWVAAGVAGVGMLAPYWMIDIYERGAIGEVWAIATLPWILWTTQQVIKRPKPIWPMLRLALAFGLLALSHLPILLLFTLVWLPMPWCLTPRGQHRPAVWRCYGGLVLAWGWTAFYLLPAAFDQRLVQVDVLNMEPDYQPQNRLLLTGLWRLRPQMTTHWFDATLLGPWWMMVLVTGLAAVTWGLLVYRGRSPRPQRWQPPLQLQRTTGYWLLISTVALLLMTDALGWLYPLLGPLQRIQFSWRWMSIVTIIMPLLLGYLLHLATALRRPKLMANGLAGIITLVMTVSALQGIAVMEQAEQDPAIIERFTDLAAQTSFPVDPQMPIGEVFLNWHWAGPEGLGLIDVFEYRPQDVTLELPPNRVYPLVAWQTDLGGALEIERWEFGLRQFSATNPSPFPQRVELRTFYYPGWWVQVGETWESPEQNEIGQLQIRIPPGTHQITVRYLGTAMNWVGYGVSGCTAIGVLAAVVYKSRRSKPVRA